MPDADSSWQSWLAQHGPSALLYARQIACAESDAHDAVQDGFLRFWQNRQAARDPLALLFACIRSAALDAKRTHARRKTRELQSAHHPQPRALEAPIEQAERRDAIERALADLPVNQREVVVLKIWAGLTFSQIAAAIHESPNTAASRYRYAMEKLAELLHEVRYE